MPPPDLPGFVASHRALLERLHTASGAARWGVSPDSLTTAVHESVRHRFPEGATPPEIERYVSALHLEDLALACACRDGQGEAWDHFVLTFRPALYAAARSIAGEDHRDLADSLYAELYGLPGRDGTRRPLLSYFHGRSRLVTWLRTVLVQRHIDRRRASARDEPLDADDESVQLPERLVARAAPEPGRAHAVVVAQDALDTAIAALDARDRLRLRLYYGEDLTLAQVGRITREHEATVSRKLERARKALRGAVERHLRDEHGLSDAAISECFAHAADAPELHMTRLLSRAEDG